MRIACEKPAGRGPSISAGLDLRVAAVVGWIAVGVLAMGCAGNSEVADEEDDATAAQQSTAETVAGRTDGKAGARSFRFDYGFTIQGLSDGDAVRVWLPVPPSNRHQTVEELERELPAAAVATAEQVHGNRMLYLEPKPSADDPPTFRVSYRVTRREVQGLADRSEPDAISPAERRTYLAANANVPVQGRPIELLEGNTLKEDRVPLARQLYDLVDDHVRYDKSQPGYGRGDAVWVCDSRRGNCSDFHSLFISLARSRKIPARFEIGFPLPDEKGKGPVAGYHCWAHFFVDGRGWIPVDISEADKHPGMKDYYFGNLTENRVAFTTGRDLVLSPPQSAGPLNFFIDPYVEVNGKPWPAEKIDRRYSFADEE